MMTVACSAPGQVLKGHLRHRKCHLSLPTLTLTLRRQRKQQASRSFLRRYQLLLWWRFPEEHLRAVSLEKAASSGMMKMAAILSLAAPLYRNLPLP